MGGIDCGLQNRLRRHEANQAIIQDVVCRLAVEMRQFVFHDCLDIFSRKLENQLTPAGVIFDEIRHIEHFFANSHVTRLLVIMLFHLRAGYCRESSSWHIGATEEKEAIGRVIEM